MSFWEISEGATLEDDVLTLYNQRPAGAFS